MLAKQAAEIFCSWAEREGLFVEGPNFGPHEPQSELLIKPVTDEGKQLLRARQIQAVGFNDEEGRIEVFTKRFAPSTKKQLAALPSAVGGVFIEYLQGAQQPIGPQPPAPFGEPALYSESYRGR